ncbi:MAG: nucleotidyltransferase domain-containing protein [Dehalococcoidia bacterium]
MTVYWHEFEERLGQDLPHLTAEDRHALAGIVERLVEAYQPERIYLFGSKARGDHGPDSDFDLLIVVPNTAAAERKGSRLAYTVLRGTGAAADVLVWTQGAFDSRLHLAASLPATVTREGRLLHAA